MNVTTLFEHFIQWMLASTILILAGGIVARLFYRKSPVWRHQIWFCILISSLLIPVLTAIHFGAELKKSLASFRFVQHSPEQVSQPALNLDESRNHLLISDSFTPPPLTNPSTKVKTAFDSSGINATSDHPNYQWILRPAIHALVICVWLGGAFLLALRWIAGERRLAAVIKTSTSIRNPIEQAIVQRVAEGLKLRKAPDLRRSFHIQTPMVVGTWKPCIILPDTETLGQFELEQIIEHECAHIKRLDPWILILQRFARLVYWMNPLLHWLNVSV